MSVDLYDILGVSPDADAETIKRAFRRLARRYHPDRNPDDPEAEARFKEALAAFEILSDPEQRRTYDRRGLAGLDTAAKAGVSTGGEPPDERGAWQGGGSFGEVFSEVVDGESPFDHSHFKNVGGFEHVKQAGGRAAGPSGGAGPGEAAAGEDLVESLEVDFLDAVLGREVTVEVGGETHRVALKQGTRSGDRLRLRGHGEPAPGPDGDPGDLLLDVEVRDHPLLRRDGLDLYLDLPVTFAEALDGGGVRVPTPEGEVRLELPAGVDSGTRLRLAGRGVARDDERGDLYAVVQIVSPDDVDGELEQVVERLEAGYTQKVREDLEL